MSSIGLKDKELEFPVKKFDDQKQERKKQKEWEQKKGQKVKDDAKVEMNCRLNTEMSSWSIAANPEITLGGMGEGSAEGGAGAEAGGVGGAGEMERVIEAAFLQLEKVN